MTHGVRVFTHTEARMAKQPKYMWRCRICRRDRREPLAPTPLRECGLALKLEDPRMPLPGEGRRTKPAPPAVIVEIEPTRTAGMSRDEILEAVAQKKASLLH